MENEAELIGGPAATRPAERRVASIDAFRGFVIFGMLLVNNIALDVATPKHLTHAAENTGLHFADLIFPWFLFISGVALPQAAAAARRLGTPAYKRYLRTLRRVASLVMLGWLVDSTVFHKLYLGLGVLQMIGLAYGVAYIFSGLRASGRIAVAAVLLLIHWAAMRFITPHGLTASAGADNLIKWMNDMYLVPHGIRGLTSVAPTSALVLIGSVAGDVLRSESTPLRRAMWLLANGAVLTAGGILWNLDIPYSKAMWTASYILFSGGAGTVLLGIFYLAADCSVFSAWTFPFVVFGSNAITAYVLPIIVKITIFQSWTLENGSDGTLYQTVLSFLYGSFGRVTGGWIYTISYICFWWFVMFLFYRKKLFIRV